MKITTIIENTTNRPELDVEEGLSLLIEHNGKNILFDTGISSHMISNAKTLGIALEDVDICVISHGHFDHTGGLSAFLA